MKRKSSKQQQGLTLIEVIVTVAIIGILAAIAIPSYEHYTTKTKRDGGKTSVQRVRGLLEQYYVNNKSYTDDLTALGFSNSPLNVDKTGEEVAAGSANTVYQVSVNTKAAGTLTYCASCNYEIVATPKNTQATNDTDCKILWFGSLGNKGATGSKGTACW